jgi:two-component system, chemotaxis family, protein-glutamate methylesterase/glutaminase
MREIQGVGGYTIAQDESTCVVYGIPAAAIKQQAVHEVLPVEKIAEGILIQLSA